MRVLRAGAKDLRLYPGRTLLVALSLLLGVLAVVGITAAGQMSRDVLVAQEEQRTGRAPTYAATMTKKVMTPEAAGQMIDAVHQADRRTAGSWAVISQAQLVVGRPDPRGLRPHLAAMGVTWLSGDLTRVRRVPVVSGRGVAIFAEDPVYPGVLVMNQAAAANLGGARHLVWGRAGDSVLHLASVAGVVGDGSSEPRLYGSLSSALVLDPMAADTSLTVLVHPPSSSTVDPGGLLDDLVHDARFVMVEKPRRLDRVSEIGDGLAALQIAFLASAVVALGIAAVGILNIGLASIRERARELVVRRAVGATRGDLMGMVLVSALFVAAGVTVAAGLLAYAGVRAAAAWVPAASAVQAPEFPWHAAIAGAAAASLTAVLGSLVPAVLAGRLDPATVLRE